MYFIYFTFIKSVAINKDLSQQLQAKCVRISEPDMTKKPYYWKSSVHINMLLILNKMLFETAAMLYCTMYKESKLAYRNDQVRYALLSSKSTLVITQGSWELQTAWAIRGSTLSCREIPMCSIK